MSHVGGTGRRKCGHGRAMALICFGASMLGSNAHAQTEAVPASEVCRPAFGASGTEVVRRRPGESAPTNSSMPCDPSRLPALATEALPPPSAVPDRWRVVEGLGYHVDWLNSYQGLNPLKADRPIWGRDEFLNLNAVAGTLLEERRIPTTGIGISDGLGSRTATASQLFFNQSLSLDTTLYRGDTVFRPPDWQWRLTTVFSEAGTAANGHTANAATSALQALWFEKHLRDVSARYDFDSMRIGIQPMTSDFRGFLLSDQPLAARLFGTRQNSTLQYNLALIQRLPRNRLSLNDVSAPWPRNEILLGNLYWQDFPRSGITSEIVGAWSRSRAEGEQLLLTPESEHAALTAKHDFDVGYLGYGLDGHLGRVNLTAVTYGQLGHEQQSPFTGRAAQVEGWFAASELSIDSDWRRWRLSMLHASGDGNPTDGLDRGFDNLNASPVFAGTDSSFFIHQQLSLEGGAFNLKVRNGLLPDLRPLSDGGQSNFSNPGLNLIGLGVDCDLARQWRVSLDANELWFDRTGVLAALLQRPQVATNVGTEWAVNTFFRPWANQNMIVRASGSMLMRGPGYRALYDGGNPVSAFVFLTFSY